MQDRICDNHIYRNSARHRFGYSYIRVVRPQSGRGHVRERHVIVTSHISTFAFALIAQDAMHGARLQRAGEVQRW